MFEGIFRNAPPPVEKKMTFGPSTATQNRYIAQTVLVSQKVLSLCFTLKNHFMKLRFSNSVYKKDLSNSIYQQKGASFGLSVSGGMQINNRPDGITGIAQAASIRKDMKRSQKVQMMSEAVFLGNIKSEMMEGPEMD
jgi:hypothetical protein